MIHLSTRFVLALLLIGCCESVGVEQPWPQFRGPEGDGHDRSAADVPTEWSESENVSWKTEIRGAGWSSPVVWGKQIWLTCSTVDAVPAEEAKGVDAEKPFPVALARNLKLYAVCVDSDSGGILHEVLLIEEESPESIHTMNSYASSTAVISEGRLYCHFGTNGTACVDTQSGEILWRNRELSLDHSTGAGSSPFLWNNLLIVHCDGIDVQYVAALNTNDGSLAWKTSRSGALNEIGEFKKAFCTPVMITTGGEETLVSAAADWVYGYDPATGSERWKVPYGELGFSTTPQPIVSEGMLYLCTGFMRSRMLAFKIDETQSNAAPELVWDYDKQVPTITSPLLVDGNIYFVSEQGGVLTVLNAQSGEPVWRKRLGGNYASSPLFANGHIYLFNREGEATVIKPGNEFQLVSKNQLDGSFQASPAVTENALILRTEKALYRIEQSR